jgi:hypothetical protein
VRTQPRLQTMRVNRALQGIHLPGSGAALPGYSLTDTTPGPRRRRLVSHQNGPGQQPRPQRRPNRLIWLGGRPAAHRCYEPTGRSSSVFPGARRMLIVRMLLARKRDSTTQTPRPAIIVRAFRGRARQHRCSRRQVQESLTAFSRTDRTVRDCGTFTGQPAGR